MTDKQKDEIIWNVAKPFLKTLNKSAAFIMLESDMCTQEAPIQDYIIVKNISDAIEYNNPEELKKNLPVELYNNIKESFVKFVKE